jgi:predicted glycogen debranching enzyme
MISFGRGVCNNFSESSEREWLETNGRGAYAMGTVSGGHTRRYHGLLTLALRPPVKRFQAVNRLEEALFIGGAWHGISAQSYPGTIHPQGFQYLEHFELNPFPVWTYVISDVRLKKTFFLRYGEDTAVVLYELVSGPEVLLEARPLLTCRDHHATTLEDTRFTNRWDGNSHTVRVRTSAGPDVFLCSEEGQFRSDAFWYRNQEYVWEERRGLEHREDAFAPGTFRFRLRGGQSAALVFSTEEKDSRQAPAWARQEQVLRRRLVEKSLVRGPLADTLVLAADKFLVARDPGTTVMAGYPWFEDWGRDAMISLPGLTLATGRAEEAGEILDLFARHIVQGLVPNRFPDGGEPPDYRSADAALWFVWAVQKYGAAVGNPDRLRGLLPAVRQIVDAFQGGTLFGIRMDEDGLIAVPEPSVTWMDARVNERAVTARTGKPVEIQALWYNALQFLAEMDLKFQEPARGYDKLAAVARRHFNEKFWDESIQYLADGVEGRRKDLTIRPNALLAISLPYEILEESRFKPVVERAWRDLYTSYGLRSVSPFDPAYQGRYNGPPAVRDSAYHQGTAWAWLLGSFLTAFAKAYGPSEETKSRIHDFLEPFVGHLSEAGLGQVSEIFEGDAPHAARGCPAQAWSVAELLRVMWEENILI